MASPSRKVPEFCRSLFRTESCPCFSLQTVNLCERMPRLLRVFSIGTRSFALLSAAILLGVVGVGVGQDNPNVGLLPFSTQDQGVDLATGSVSAFVPTRDKTGKIPFSFSLFGNYSLFKWKPGAGTPQWWESTYVTSGLAQIASWGNAPCSNNRMVGLYVQDVTAARHPVPGSIPSCSVAGQNFTGTTSDRSGYTLVIVNGVVTVYDRSGNAIPNTAFKAPIQITDPDGATITFTTNGTTLQYVDSLGQIALAADGGTYTYTDRNGNTQSYTVTGTTYNWITNFACSGINDSNYSNWFQLPTSVATPTGEHYSFVYEQTPGYGTGNVTGRISRIVYPTGGYIAYSYSGGHNGINCNSGVIPTLTVTVSDRNGNTNTWIYTNTNNSSTPGNYTVTVQDPANNNTVYSFAGEYQTQTQVYQGSVSPSNLVSTVVTCYNGNFTSCATPATVPALPFSQIDVYTYPTGSSSPSLQETKYDTYGNTVELKTYDFGVTIPPSGNPVADTTITYNGGNGVTCGALANAYMHDRPCAVTTVSASGATVSQVLYTYNATGHVTETQKWVGGSNYLTSYASYSSNGTLASSTDVNGAVTNYSYNGSGGCNGLLLTSTTYPVNGLSTSQQWDCNGGVITQTADANGQATQYGYLNQAGVADPLWRLNSVTDPLNNTTWTTYTPASGTSFETKETALTFGSSTVDYLSTVDGLGRAIYVQKRQGPAASTSTFDSVQYTYGWNSTGFITTKSVPYPGTAGQAAPGGTAVTTTQYDALHRLSSLVSASGATLSTTYGLNDAYQTLGPAPSGENAKRRNFEYDGLGRMKSVCEITSASGSGTCSQSSPQQGFWTQYSYDALGRLTNVNQNGTQTRTFAYDGLGRLKFRDQSRERARKLYVRCRRDLRNL